MERSSCTRHGSVLEPGAGNRALLTEIGRPKETRLKLPFVRLLLRKEYIVRTVSRYLSVSALLAASPMVVACGGPVGSQISPSASAATAPASPSYERGPKAAARHPVAHPTLLIFYSEHPLRFKVRETGYYGRFTVSDSACNGIASVSPKSAKGPKARFKVTPIESPSGGECVVSVADDHGYSAKVTVVNPGY